ncbi:unnamed protein product [Pseudo-nitzschia multistriata]|uniref:SET domain-containing protein n=1 Tax=Pseudo-nitzschia multistriata TaxID=183589 RepID=A0A448Z349_9STRA|nr:unnamed protein product [Pseudo-nitzschia multistriata]
MAMSLSMVVSRWIAALLLLSQLLPRGIVADSKGSVFDKKENEEKLIEWIRSRGGYWNPGQELRYDETVPGLYGVFASEPIERHAVLAKIPWECVIYPDDEDESEDQDHPDRFDENCRMVQRLADELQTERDAGAGGVVRSDFSHYVEGLIQTATEHSKLLPAHWSEGGKKLLSRVLFDDDETGEPVQVLPPEDVFWIHDDWKHRCEARVDPVATLLVTTHGEDFGMVPLTDKFNSRGGNWTGAFFSVENGDGPIALEIRALRDLAAGEQIYTDYHDYGQIGTPELLRDYGFVEAYPQRWIFHHHGIAFDVLEKHGPRDAGGGDDRFQIEWHDRINSVRYVGKPSSSGVEILRRHLDRLDQTVVPALEAAAAPETKDAFGRPTELERETVLRFCHDLASALELAIRDAEAASATPDPEL